MESPPIHTTDRGEEDVGAPHLTIVESRGEVHDAPHSSPALPVFTEPALTRVRASRPLPPYVTFPVPYAVSAAGLAAANEELTRLMALYTAYKSQPDITPLWQGYIDQRAAAVSKQRAAISGLEAAISVAS
jgi:hypothetical protein